MSINLPWVGRGAESRVLIIGPLKSSQTKYFLEETFKKWGHIDVQMWMLWSQYEKYANITFHKYEDAKDCYDHYHCGPKPVPILDDKSIKLVFPHDIYLILESQTNDANDDCLHLDFETLSISSFDMTSTQISDDDADDADDLHLEFETLSISKQPINVNECSVEDFQKIKGIGKKIAANLNEKRRIQPFTSTDDMIRRIKGMGKKRMNDIENTMKISFVLLAFAYCNQTCKKLDIEINGDIIGIIKDYSYLTQHADKPNLPKKPGSKPKLKNKPKNKPAFRGRCRITNGVNSGYVFNPTEYKSNKRWRPLRR